MSDATTFFLVVVVVFAAWLVAHLATLWGALRGDVSAGWKWLALLPPLTPVAAWRARRRARVIVWAALLATYGVLRLVGG